MTSTKASRAGRSSGGITFSGRLSRSRSGSAPRSSNAVLVRSAGSSATWRSWRCRSWVSRRRLGSSISGSVELVGAPNFPANLSALAERARICVIGVGAGPKIELNLHALMAKRARIHGSVLRARSLEDKADAARRVERAVLPGFASGDLSVPVTATFPLDRVADAYARFQAGAKLGKIVLEL